MDGEVAPAGNGGGSPVDSSGAGGTRSEAVAIAQGGNAGGAIADDHPTPAAAR
jgi:hypothetical protein